VRGFGQIREPSFYVGLTHGSWSFLTTPFSISGIENTNDPLGPGMYVHMPDLHRLLVAPPITVEGLDHLILKPKQLDGITAIYVDEVLRHLLLALSKQASRNGFAISRRIAIASAV
jgi:hypothetical protein